MTFAELEVGDHFIWPWDQKVPLPASADVHIKIARGDDGGGFAVNLATRQDSTSPLLPEPGDPSCWIQGTVHVLKLNGRL
jgi:hypothetical protein